MAKPTDPYLVLGVARGADGTQLRRAYRRLVLALHPDLARDPASAERFREVQRAYEALAGPGAAKEAESAASTEEPRAPPEAEPGEGAAAAAPVEPVRRAVEPAPLTYSQWRHAVRLQPEPFATPAAAAFDAAMRRAFGAVDAMLGGFVPELLPGRDPSVPKDLVVELTLSASESAAGGTFPLAVPIQTRCPSCLGSGLGGTLRARCARCGGRGFDLERKQLELVVPPGTSDGAEAEMPLGGESPDAPRLRVLVRVR
jgi:DnaJ-class molecular chaperone